MLLKLREVTVAYPNTTAIARLSLDLPFGQAHALMGANGAGKTSLLKAIAGILPYSGSIQPKVLCALLPSPQHRPWPFTAREVVLMGRYPHGLRHTPSPKDLAITDQAIRTCHGEELSARPFHTLSSGEQQRVLLARTLATEAKIWLLDEPTNGLDPHHRALLWKVLMAEMKPDRLLLFTTHQFHEAKEHSQELLVLNKGELIKKGSSKAVLASEVNDWQLQPTPTKEVP